MDTKETIKYLYENGRIMSQEHYKTIYDEFTALSIQSKSRFNDWLLARAENKRLKEVIEAAISQHHRVMPNTVVDILIREYEALKG